MTSNQDYQSTGNWRHKYQLLALDNKRRSNEKWSVLNNLIHPVYLWTDIPFVHWSLCSVLLTARILSSRTRSQADHYPSRQRRHLVQQLQSTLTNCHTDTINYHQNSCFSLTVWLSRLRWLTKCLLTFSAPKLMAHAWWYIFWHMKTFAVPDTSNDMRRVQEALAP